MAIASIRRLVAIGRLMNSSEKFMIAVAASLNCDNHIPHTRPAQCALKLKLYSRSAGSSRRGKSAFVILLAEQIVGPCKKTQGTVFGQWQAIAATEIQPVQAIEPVDLRHGFSEDRCEVRARYQRIERQRYSRRNVLSRDNRKLISRYDESLDSIADDRLALQGI